MGLPLLLVSKEYIWMEMIFLLIWCFITGSCAVL